MSPLILRTILVTSLSRHLVNVSVTIQLEFYYNEYDWGVIYRQIGAGEVGTVGQNNKFYKVTEDDHQTLIVNKYESFVSDKVQST